MGILQDLRRKVIQVFARRQMQSVDAFDLYSELFGRRSLAEKQTSKHQTAIDFVSSVDGRWILESDHRSNPKTTCAARPHRMIEKAMAELQNAEA